MCYASESAYVDEINSVEKMTENVEAEIGDWVIIRYNSKTW